MTSAPVNVVQFKRTFASADLGDVLVFDRASCCEASPHHKGVKRYENGQWTFGKPQPPLFYVFGDSDLQIVPDCPYVVVERARGARDVMVWTQTKAGESRVETHREKIGVIPQDHWDDPSYEPIRGMWWWHEKPEFGFSFAERQCELPKTYKLGETLTNENELFRVCAREIDRRAGQVVVKATSTIFDEKATYYNELIMRCAL